MQCPSCRQEVSGAFCNFCGATLAVPAGSVPSAIPTQAAGAGLSANAAAAIAYLTVIPAIVFLVMEPYNRMPLVRFHSIQNIALSVAWVIVWVALTIVHTFLYFVPFVGILFILVDLAVAIGFFVAWLIALMKASKGEYFKLPFIGAFAAKQAGV